MERLPYIDEHATEIDSDRAHTWDALLSVVCKDPAAPTPPAGFRVDEADAPNRLVLRGRHPFSIYELAFTLDDTGPSRTRLTAYTHAAFPGLHGKIYRALVIGSGGHRIVVGRMLRKIAAAA